MTAPYNDFNFIESGYIASEPYDFLFGDLVTIYNILIGSSNNFKAIWADETSSMNAGKFYVAAPDSFSIVDIANNSLYDRYTATVVGRGGESLSSNDLIDVSVGG